MKKIMLLSAFVVVMVAVALTAAFSRGEVARVALEAAMKSYAASSQWILDRYHVIDELKRVEVSDQRSQARVEAAFAQMIRALKNSDLSKSVPADILWTLENKGQITTIVSTKGFFIRSLLFKTAFSIQAVKYLKEESELAAVVAHELGHLVRLDMKRVQLAEINGFSGVDQEVEQAADVFALRLLRTGGQDPAALLRVLERFQRDKLDRDPAALAMRIAAVREALKEGF